MFRANSVYSNKVLCLMKDESRPLPLLICGAENGSGQLEKRAVAVGLGDCSRVASANPTKLTESVAANIRPSIRARREYILSKAAQLVATYGISRVTLKMISAESGVAVQTLYNNFGDKEHLICDMIGKWTVDLFRSAQASDDLSFRTLNFCQVMAESFSEWPSFYRECILYTTQGDDRFVSIIHGFARRVIWEEIDYLMKKGKVIEYTHRSDLAYAICSLNWTASVDWAKERLDTRDAHRRLLHGNKVLLLGCARASERSKIENVLP